MNMIKNFNKVIDYIENNLDKEIKIGELAQIANTSSFHLMRIFSALSGVGISEYIRKRKMTKVAEELQISDIKIIDLATKYGYESSTAFTRAFKEIHGVSPSVARSENTRLKSYLPITFSLTITGGEKMEYRIEKIEGFRALGYKRTYNFKTGENFEKIPQFWNEMFSTGKFENIMSLNNNEPLGTLGICTNLRENEFDYFIAVSTDKDRVDDMEEIVIDTQTYAIFTCEIEQIQNITKRIFAEWLPNSEYEHVEDAAEIEIYPDSKTCEICIPVRK